MSFYLSQFLQLYVRFHLSETDFTLKCGQKIEKSSFKQRKTFCGSKISAISARLTKDLRMDAFIRGVEGVDSRLGLNLGVNEIREKNLSLKGPSKGNERRLFLLFWFNCSLSLLLLWWFGSGMKEFPLVAGAAVRDCPVRLEDPFLENIFFLSWWTASVVCPLMMTRSAPLGRCWPLMVNSGLLSNLWLVLSKQTAASMAGMVFELRLTFVASARSHWVWVFLRKFARLARSLTACQTLSLNKMLMVRWERAEKWKFNRWEGRIRKIQKVEWTLFDTIDYRYEHNTHVYVTHVRRNFSLVEKVEGEDIVTSSALCWLTDTGTYTHTRTNQLIGNIVKCQHKWMDDQRVCENRETRERERKR